MTNLYKELQRRLSDPATRKAWEEATGGDPEVKWPIFSFDNATIHTDAEVLQALHLVAGVTWMVLPARSPDLHRCIERVHARICGLFQNWLYDDDTPYCMRGYCDELRSIFLTKETPKTTQKDLKKIHELYTRVLELKGRYPEKKYR